MSKLQFPRRGPRFTIRSLVLVIALVAIVLGAWQWFIEFCNQIT